MLSFRSARVFVFVFVCVFVFVAVCGAVDAAEHAVPSVSNVATSPAVSADATPPYPIHSECWGLETVNCCEAQNPPPELVGPCNMASQCPAHYRGDKIKVLVCADVGWASIPEAMSGFCARFDVIGCFAGACVYCSNPSATWETLGYELIGSPAPDCARSVPCVPAVGPSIGNTL